MMQYFVKYFSADASYFFSAELLVIFPFEVMLFPLDQLVDSSEITICSNYRPQT